MKYTYSLVIDNKSNDDYYIIISNSLKNIIQHTTSITKDELLKSIPYQYQDGIIKIIVQSNDKVIKYYPVPFKENKMFFDINYLIQFTILHIKDKDYMNYFINKYYNDLKDIKYFNIINIIYEEYNNYLNNNILSNKLIKSIETFIIIYSNKSYNSLFDLAMFNIRYNDNDLIQYMINHYESLINDSTLEERKYYIDYIKSLERKR